MQKCCIILFVLSLCFCSFCSAVKSFKRFVSFQIAFQLCHPLCFEVQTILTGKYFFSSLFSMALATRRLIAVTTIRASYLANTRIPLSTIFFHFLSLYLAVDSPASSHLLFPNSSENVFHVEYQGILTLQSLPVLFRSRQHKSGFFSVLSLSGCASEKCHVNSINFLFPA